MVDWACTCGDAPSPALPRFAREGATSAAYVMVTIMSALRRRRHSRSHHTTRCPLPCEAGEGREGADHNPHCYQINMQVNRHRSLVTCHSSLDSDCSDAPS